MMMNTTLAQLRTLKLDGLAAGLEEQLAQPTMAAMSFEERLALLIDREVHVSIGIQNFPPIGVQFFPLFSLVERGFYDA